jgi:hypothetical protein
MAEASQHDDRRGSASLHIASTGGRRPSTADGGTRLRPHPVTAEDLGDDVMALAVVARSAGRASVLRQVDGVLVRVTVEAA